MSQQRKTMCTYMKNMAGYKMEHFKGKSFYEVKEMQKTGEGSEPTEELKADEISQEDLQQMIMVVPVEEVYVEALQVKYPIIDWEVYSEDTRKYLKIIRVGNHTEAYQTFDDMLKKFDRDDLDKLWSLVKERLSSTDPTDDKERTLWVELKRLFEPDTDDILGHDIFMLVEKDYPLTRGLLTLMLCNKLQVDQYSEMADEILRKIVILANIPRQKYKTLHKKTKLDLPEELSRVHNTFHVSNLKKCYADEPLAVPLDGLHFDDKLQFVEEPVEIMDREVKRLKRSRIPLVKVRWNSKRGPEFTWEREDQFKKKYPHLFTKTAPSSSAASRSVSIRCQGYIGDFVLGCHAKDMVALYVPTESNCFVSTHKADVHKKDKFVTKYMRRCLHG
ncbi:hypothetical protein Tco_0673429, partial [Tanacetum coccineum]